MTEYKVKLITPMPPNFIFLDTGEVGRRQDGFRERPKIAVAALTAEQKDSLAADWRKSLDEVAARQNAASE